MDFGSSMDFEVRDIVLDSRWGSRFTMDYSQRVLAFSMDSRLVSGFTMLYWIHDGFLDSHLIPGFSMDSWILDVFLDSQWGLC